MASPSAAATLFSSTRLTPLAITRTGRPDLLRNTSDLAICATVQPMAAAASAALRAVASNMRTAQSEPAARNCSCTRCAAAGRADELPLICKLPRARCGGGDRALQQGSQPVRRHQHLERGKRRAARARDVLAQHARGLRRLARQLAGAG